MALDDGSVEQYRDLTLCFLERIVMEIVQGHKSIVE